MGDAAAARPLGRVIPPWRGGAVARPLLRWTSCFMDGELLTFTVRNGNVVSPWSIPVAVRLIARIPWAGLLATFVVARLSEQRSVPADARPGGRTRGVARPRLRPRSPPAFRRASPGAILHLAIRPVREDRADADWARHATSGRVAMQAAMTAARRPSAEDFLELVERGKRG